jgi:hypothetical protein
MGGTTVSAEASPVRRSSKSEGGSDAHHIQLSERDGFREGSTYPTPVIRLAGAAFLMTGVVLIRL